MDLHSFQDFKLLVAVFAFVGPLASVNSSMFFQGVGHGEGGAANITNIGLLFCMNPETKANLLMNSLPRHNQALHHSPFMALHLPLAHKLLPTMFTLEILCVCVPQNVLLHIGNAAKVSTTKRTNCKRLLRVGSHVFTQHTLQVIALAAQVALKLCRINFVRL